MIRIEELAQSDRTFRTTAVRSTGLFINVILTKLSFQCVVSTLSCVTFTIKAAGWNILWNALHERNVTFSFMYHLSPQPSCTCCLRIYFVYFIYLLTTVFSVIYVLWHWCECPTKICRVSCRLQQMYQNRWLNINSDVANYQRFRYLSIIIMFCSPKTHKLILLLRTNTIIKYNYHSYFFIYTLMFQPYLS